MCTWVFCGLIIQSVFTLLVSASFTCYSLNLGLGLAMASTYRPHKPLGSKIIFTMVHFGIYCVHCCNVIWRTTEWQKQLVFMEANGSAEGLVKVATREIQMPTKLAGNVKIRYSVKRECLNFIFSTYYFAYF